MNTPKVIADLIQAQANFDSAAYSNYFAESAVVYDEGSVHKGRAAIKNWNESTNSKYHFVLKPLAFEENSPVFILTTEVSGTFPGSPITVRYHFELEDNLIKSLKVSD